MDLMKGANFFLFTVSKKNAAVLSLSLKTLTCHGKVEQSAPRNDQFQTVRHYNFGALSSQPSKYRWLDTEEPLSTV